MREISASTVSRALSAPERLAPRIHADRLVVAESGIAGRNDVKRLQTAGASVFLVGECLMRSADIGAKLDELIND